MQHQMTKVQTRYIAISAAFDIEMREHLTDPSRDDYELVSTELVKADKEGTTVLLFWKKP